MQVDDVQAGEEGEEEEPLAEDELVDDDSDDDCMDGASAASGATGLTVRSSARGLMGPPAVPLKMSLGTLGEQAEPKKKDMADKTKKKRKADEVEAEATEDIIDEGIQLDAVLKTVAEALGKVEARLANSACFQGLLPDVIVSKRHRPGHQLRGVSGWQWSRLGLGPGLGFLSLL